MEVVLLLLVAHAPEAQEAARHTTPHQLVATTRPVDVTSNSLSCA